MMIPAYDAYPKTTTSLILGYKPLSRVGKKIAKAKLKQSQDNGWGGHVPGTGPLARKRRAKPFGKHNKDR